jgi:5'-nucleotidase
MPQILVTNDDGVLAPGLAALAEAMAALGTVTVVAPSKNWSASGHVKTMHKPLRLQEATLSDGRPAWACSGAPSDCVALALMGALKQDFDLVVSGINPHANMGQDVTYSGTVTAAMEAALMNRPGIAVSTDWDQAIGYGPAAEAGLMAVRMVLARGGLPPGLLLSVNAPSRPSAQILGVRVTRLGQRDYRDELVVRDDPYGRPYYWIGGEGPIALPGEGTDVEALAAGYISITPLNMDMTARSALEDIRGWGWEREA